MTAAPRRKLLGQVLKEMRRVHEGQIQEALSVQKERGGPIGRILIEMRAITEGDLVEALGRQAGMEVVDLDAIEIPPDVIAKVDATAANLLRIVPVREDAGTLIVAMADPMNVAALDDLRFSTGGEVKGAISSEAAVTRAIERYYGKDLASASEIFAEAERAIGGTAARAQSGPIDLADREAMARSAPIVKLLNYVLFQAIRDKASDIHLEPFERDFKIRYRIDGVLYELEPPPRHLAEAIISRVKVMANLDIAETRIPQDGRIELTISGRAVDIRVSTLPTLFGESCVMRVLDRSVVSLDLEQIGLREKELEAIRALLVKPFGIVLVTGPTGSGKTTTLYSALNEANDIARKIITTEDPVEYDLDGIVQVPIAEDIGVTYAACLRSILRQDPDMILVGEIRDRETAQIAIEASLTGHVVFSTLHTNDAPSAVTRMIDIGIEPYLLAATLDAVIAQRLVRRICEHCRTFYEPTEDALRELSLDPRDVLGKKFAYGKGCDLCHSSGFRGRTAIFEILLVNPRLRQMIVDGGSTDALRSAAVATGMRTLRESGLLAIYDGITTIEEVVRETLLVR
ncbi:MAG: Flp pilus assembly complex ATPase component TadA [Planctomycetes bacterium]|nr:Flp pilus assembly complex ATPase component TadA [Planctomycetota bacterium]MBI3844601.1 Flp pilus assembly complex ATPase component TadA [Planctomycetota bacterium]